MARLVIPKTWWDDPRRAVLIKELGDAVTADGVYLNAINAYKDAGKPIHWNTTLKPNWVSALEKADLIKLIGDFIEVINIDNAYQKKIPELDALRHKLGELYKLYPKRSGDHGKLRGLLRLERQFHSIDNPLLADFEQAVIAYRTHCQEKDIENTAFVKQFVTFANPVVWTEWAEMGDDSEDSDYKRLVALIKDQEKKNREERTLYGKPV